ncbi:cytoskeleton-associated protein 2-like isoform X2 [Chroicocephalus ridibundus]|uniref:cytoskeleton-associated protein 2-like isoform X2 n=1 Tax=Chroicocephalus ridibundus TaxID=1192867 RepID=UPI002FDD8C7A
MSAARRLAAAAGGSVGRWPRGPAEASGRHGAGRAGRAGAEKTAPGVPSSQRKAEMPKCKVDKNKDVLRNVAKGPQRDGKLGTKSTEHVGHTAPQKSSNTSSQRAAVARPEPPRKSARPPMGLMPSISHHTQPRGRLPASNPGHLNPERSKKPARETAAPQAGSEHPPPEAPCSLSEGLRDRLVCNKENVRAQASARPVQNRVFQSDGNNLGSKRDLARRQSSATMSRTIMDPKDRINSRQAKEEPIQDKFRKTLPGSKSTSQKPSVKTQPLQPPRLLSASTNLLHKKTEANQEKTNTAREPVGKPLGIVPAGGLKHHSRAPQLRRSPTKLLASSRPRGTTNMKSSLKPGSTVPWQRPTAKEEAGRKEVKVVPPRHTAASRAAVPQNQPRSIHGSKTQATASDFSGRDRLKPKLPMGSGIQARRVPKTPSAADRKKQLEEWLASKGKIYKRPPMMLLQKKAVKLSWRNVKEKEKQEKPEQLCLEKIDDILTECLKLVEEGVQAEDISAVLSQVPQAEKFAKFWICKAKLLARIGPFDVTGLYKAAVCAGAAPLQELREVVLDILKAAGQTSEGEKAEQPVPCEPTTPCPNERQHVAVTPCPTGRSLTSLPVSVKLQVTSASRGKELLGGRELKFLTPVRRSLRIEGAGSHYPEMLKDHDPVVSSLSEILDAEEETQFFFRKNKALPEVAELEGLSLYPPECC